MRDRDDVIDPVLDRWLIDHFLWLPEVGVGTYPVDHRDATTYDQDYWAKYEAYANSPLGRALTARRVELVTQFAPKAIVVDVGIGCGQFIQSLHGIGRAAFGYDVSPIGVQWLKDNGWWFDPYAADCDVATFWDSLEHIHEPGRLLARVRHTAIVSIPIFRDGDHVLTSRHYRKSEHRWYFTRDGLIRWMDGHGFRCLHHDTSESLLGREDIHTFVFSR